jgi:hypothetical protein
LLIQWIRQNHGKLPERRKNAPELISLTPDELNQIEAIVAERFQLTEHAQPGLSDVD